MRHAVVHGVATCRAEQVLEAGDAGRGGVEEDIARLGADDFCKQLIANTRSTGRLLLSNASAFPSWSAVVIVLVKGSSAFLHRQARPRHAGLCGQPATGKRASCTRKRSWSSVGHPKSCCLAPSSRRRQATSKRGAAYVRFFKSKRWWCCFKQRVIHFRLCRWLVVHSRRCFHGRRPARGRY